MGNSFSSFFYSKKQKSTDSNDNSVIIAKPKDVVATIIEQLKQYANSETARKQSAFHNTNDVESKDIFLGVPKPICKQIMTQYATTATFDDISQLLRTPNNEHEVKFVGCLLLVAKASDATKQNNAKLAYDFYFNHLATFTSWDLIDETAPIIVGNYLHAHSHYPRDDLYRLIKSRSDWDKRIALVATEAFVDAGDFTDALRLCELCFNEISPMIQKTAGKTLKDIGKKNKSVLFEFIAQNQTKMPKGILNVAMGNLSATLKKTIRSETRVLLKK